MRDDLDELPVQEDLVVGSPVPDFQPGVYFLQLPDQLPCLHFLSQPQPGQDNEVQRLPLGSLFL